jgi:hypothetical protein
MRKFILSITLCIFMLPIQAADITEREIVNQENDQNACAQQRLSDCLSIMCRNSSDEECTQTCTENAKNECRQAGE